MRGGSSNNSRGLKSLIVCGEKSRAVLAAALKGERVVRLAVINDQAQVTAGSAPRNMPSPRRPLLCGIILRQRLKTPDGSRDYRRGVPLDAEPDPRMVAPIPSLGNPNVAGKPETG